MTPDTSDPPANKPILTKDQSRLLSATLALYRAQASVDDAAAGVDRAAHKSRLEIIEAHLALCAAERSLRALEVKRADVVARIAREAAEARGERWLRVAS